MSDVDVGSDQGAAGTKYSAMDVVAAALNKEPGTARIAYDQLVLDRAFKLVQDKRLEVAKEFGNTGYYNRPQEDETNNGETDISGEMGSGTGPETSGEGEAGDGDSSDGVDSVNNAAKS